MQIDPQITTDDGHRRHANTLLIEGELNSPTFKKIWAKEGPEAYSLANNVYAARPNDVNALAVYADAFVFSNSAKGIVQQAFTGAGPHFVKISNELISKHEVHMPSPNWFLHCGGCL